MHHRLVTLALAMILALSCTLPCAAQPVPNATLAGLLADDQADRAGPPQRIDWAVVGPRDDARRAATARLLQAGELRAAADFHAAAMIFQHGPAVEDIQLAYALATVGRQMDPGNQALHWLSAAAWDRYLMRRGKPQWYGTQYRLNPANQRFELYTVDETAVTDQDRAALHVPTLAEARAREAEFNR